MPKSSMVILTPSVFSLRRIDRARDELLMTTPSVISNSSLSAAKPDSSNTE